jgi:hypothetical protein
MADKNNPERLTHAYDRMLERVKAALEATEEITEEALDSALDEAGHMAEDLDDLAKDEAELVQAYVRRDLHDLGEYVERTGREYSSWFYIDTKLIEARLLDLITSVADKTSVQLAALAQRARESSTWHTGEITGPGALRCQNCGEILHFTKTSHIPPCPKCKGTSFVREKGEE